MPRMRLLIDSTPIRLIRRLMAQRDYRSAWPGVRDILRDSFRKIFESQGNGRWPRLSAETLKWREEIGASGKPMLNVNGRLVNSVLGGSESIGGATGVVMRESITLGSEVPYSGLHQLGGEVKQPLRSKLAKKAFKLDKNAKGQTVVKRIPARPFLTAGGTPENPELDETTGGAVAETFGDVLARRITALFTGGANA